MNTKISVLPGSSRRAEFIPVDSHWPKIEIFQGYDIDTLTVNFCRVTVAQITTSDIEEIDDYVAYIKAAKAIAQMWNQDFDRLPKDVFK